MSPHKDEGPELTEDSRSESVSEGMKAEIIKVLTSLEGYPYKYSKAFTALITLSRLLASCPPAVAKVFCPPPPPLINGDICCLIILEASKSENHYRLFTKICKQFAMTEKKKHLISYA